ncbi:hypothetical protein GS500_04680 [Rhodococcus hoagii]|nr:hypothetical protein [Prescottella equi]
MTAHKIEFFDRIPGEIGSNRKGKWAWFADELRSNPGQWAKMPTTSLNPGNTAYQIRLGRLTGFDAGQFEAASVKGSVYVRFIGGAE